MSSRFHAHPPLWRFCYVLFARIWNLNSDSAADEAYIFLNSLDEILRSKLEDPEESWLPNPYGAVAVFANVEACVESIEPLMAALPLLSIGIAWGELERTHSINTWSAAAVPINEAARLASIKSVQGHVAVTKKVREDLWRSKIRYRDLFGAEQTATIKEAEFRYYLLSKLGPEGQKRSRSGPVIRLDSMRSLPANIVSCDIEKYSRKPTHEQAKISNILFRLVEQSLFAVGGLNAHWTPAGDGGQVIFRESSAPQAWNFARSLFEEVSNSGVPLRIGIEHGPILESKYRAAVGGRC